MRTDKTTSTSEAALNDLLANLDLLPTILNPRLLDALDEDVGAETGDLETALRRYSFGGPPVGVELLRGGDRGDPGGEIAERIGGKVKNDGEEEKGWSKTYARLVAEATRRL